MNELNLESQFRPTQLSQGFNPVKAPNVDPLLRENQQSQLDALSREQKVATRLSYTTKDSTI